MTAQTTEQALASITDEGLFERLATAILREAKPDYASLAHPGVNVAGKTVKSPLDGICFVQGANPPHMIAVHHTITARDDLEKKWLHDPSKVKPRKGTKPKAPAGDLLKTAELVAQERTRTPNLRATLVLTTNEEPGEELVRDVVAAGSAHAMAIDLWPRSRLSHFLDHHPRGQWSRRAYLGIEQEQLSAELLHELSKKSLEASRPLDDPSTWIPRTLDTVLSASLARDVTFLVAGSGMGKSVACHRKLSVHVEGGGFGLVLPHVAVESSMTLDQAITATLRQLHPALAVTGPSALSLCSPEHPLLLAVEDINRSGRPQLLLEKLVSWRRVPGKQEAGALSPWRLICPLWPETLSALSDQAQKLIASLIITAGGFSEDEGRNAVATRARRTGHELSPLAAEEITEALGHDPLLIALHDPGVAPDPHRVIGGFVERSLSRTSTGAKDYPAAQYRQALRALAGEMLASRQVELTWREVSSWKSLQGEPLRLISSLAQQGELIRIAGPSNEQRLVFRHDRIREWLLADAAAELDRGGGLADAILTEPYFAEVIGTVLAWERPLAGFVQRVASSNPLALFYALRLLGENGGSHGEAIVQAIHRWLDEPSTRDPSNNHLRWEALAILAETDSRAVSDIVHKFPDRTTWSPFARFRNGDLSGGIEACFHLEPGLGAPWRDIQIAHAKFRYGKRLSDALNKYLRQPSLNSPSRVGSLRLAGHLADPSLAPAIEACWGTDENRSAHLADYLWAFAECCGEDPPRYLNPVCDAWASLPDESEREGFPSPREGFASDEVRWAFSRWPPRAAIEYFIQRASQEDLRWPITYMLHSMDDPGAVLFVARELAADQRRFEGTDSTSVFATTAPDEWRRAQENGRPMSKASRDLLLEAWQSEGNDKYLRRAAFSLWSQTKDPKDLEVLRTTKPSAELADRVLAARLTREDPLAIPAMIEKITSGGGRHWWRYGRYLWSPALTQTLDEELGRHGALAKQAWADESKFDSDWITSELIQRLPTDEAERLLLKHWHHLRFSPRFVQAALYLCTPRLLDAARAAIKDCPQPAVLLRHFSIHVGMNTHGRPGLTREAQVWALVPYLHLLSPRDINSLWETCNDRSWFSLRREFLDKALKEPHSERKWNPDRLVSELDETVAEKRTVWMDLLLGSFLKADVPWPEILAVMTRWLEERRSLQALRIVAAAVLHQGTRDDMSALKIAQAMPEPAAKQLVADTQFALRRKRPR
ncbi:hypothetical protein JY651_05010 [Pyxidicoccus parkwayensis]|uniref:Uncharacterized protein n=1 Tax=Pyxidicoccus parkwayensis TaxID=2813578 RepID=A0ABX7NZR2_9BACT|nr:hypothetical protein [Pyxidicoccus parkwaysis]QSQ24329.1 hypothetical protein JY651_05010 [Pyxidicoccus parkwaysis]